MRKSLVAPLAGVGAFFVLLFAVLLAASTKTGVTPSAVPRVVGAETPLIVKLENPHGVRLLDVYMEQNGTRLPMFQQTQPATRFFFLRKHEQAREVSVTVGSKRAPGLKDGKARLVIQAKANDFRSATTTLAYDVDVNTQPPQVSADGFQHYINQGGSELVVFNVSGYWTEAGVRVGKYTFRSFPMPGQPDQTGVKSERFALFAYPWDLPPDVTPVVYARNPAGAEAVATFWHRIFPKKFRSRDLKIDDTFVSRVVNQISPGGQGDLLTRFLAINRDMRRDNNRTLADLRQQTAPQQLWNGPFLQLGNSQVEAQFADARSYYYNGKKVDEQMHLGFDLSKVQHAPIEAANDGKVIYAAPLGIYGNCAVIDHGYGLQSVYGHMSEFAIKAGDTVTKRQVIGKSGATGLAGGDHLHFTMQLDGVQINPVEWWDSHWIHDRIESKLRKQS